MQFPECVDMHAKSMNQVLVSVCSNVSEHVVVIHVSKGDCEPVNMIPSGGLCARKGVYAGHVLGEGRWPYMKCHQGTSSLV